MSFRKERIHRCGFSNIDFRSKNDEESLKVFQPWKCKTTFGTMGYTDYKLDPDYKKKLMGVSEKINKQRDNVEEVPDPKYYKTARYYNEKKMPIKEKTVYTDERFANLDETGKGKEMYTGDSMMISYLTKNRKLAKSKFSQVEESRKKGK